MNTAVEVSSLVSSSELPAREGEGERERFYLTTAINYTNGKAFARWSSGGCGFVVDLRVNVFRRKRLPPEMR